MASDTPQLWDGVPLTAIHLPYHFTFLIIYVGQPAGQFITVLFQAISSENTELWLTGCQQWTMHN